MVFDFYDAQVKRTFKVYFVTNLFCVSKQIWCLNYNEKEKFVDYRNIPFLQMESILVCSLFNHWAKHLKIKLYY